MEMWYEERREERERMVAEQLVARGIRDTRVLEAMRQIPRHRFVPAATDAFARAYRDGAQRIGEGQTISQPYIVALMTEALELQGNETVLEIGVGSGYQTAILAHLCKEVIGIERHATLTQSARRVLSELGIENVRLYTGDGSQGWQTLAPYDAILAAAVAPQLPMALVTQLKPGGRLVLPVGPEGGDQQLLRLRKNADGSLDTDNYGLVSFVPLIGASGFGLPDDLGGVE